MKKSIAVYPGTFDPLTNGHLDLIQRMIPLYDKFIVMIAVNSSKQTMFTVAERMAMIKNVVKDIPNVTVVSCVDQYAVTKASELEAQVIIKCLRDPADYLYEKTLASENLHICPQIETLLACCSPEHMHTSSSLVKSHLGADPHWERQTNRLVPASIAIELKKKFVLNRAQQHWNSLMDNVGNPAKAKEVFSDIVNHYSEPHRAYHTLEHIVMMLDKFELIRSDYVKSYAKICFAIWLHDYIYSAKNTNDEELSATAAKSIIAKLGLPEILGNETSILIIVTKHSAESASDPSAEILLDLDLMILGSSQAEFDKYELGIKFEYAWVENDVFCSERTKVLQMFLDRSLSKHSSIYQTNHFKQKYEKAAQANLVKSIKLLKP